MLPQEAGKMIRIRPFIISLLVLVCVSISTRVGGQNMSVDTAGFQTFLHNTGDTTYLMKQYYMCLLKSGPKRDQSTEEAALIQENHLAHLSQLATDRKICLAGPFADDSGIQGVVIYSTPTYRKSWALDCGDTSLLGGSGGTTVLIKF